MIDVHVDVDDVTLRLALTYVLERAGCHRAKDAASARAVVTSHERPLGRDVLHVLVVQPTPAECRLAVEAVVDGRVHAVVCRDEPDQVPDAVLAADKGWTPIPARVLATARHGPRLNGRLIEVLRLVVAGRTNHQIAVRLNQSQSTIKRDIAELLRQFDVTSRLRLVSEAVALGYSQRAAAAADRSPASSLPTSLPA